MTESVSPEEFYEKVVKGTRYSKKIDLQHSDGYVLEGVEMHVVDKGTLMSFVSTLPDEILEEVAGVDDEEEARDIASGLAGGVNEETVAAFERVCKESLEHPELLEEDMHDIVEALSFEVLFELGNEIINLSFEHDGDVQDFVEHG